MISSTAQSRPSDHNLVIGLRNQDKEAYNTVINEYGPQLLAIARRITRSEEDARDCLQEAMLNAFRSIDQFQGRSSLSTWLGSIITNCAVERVRRRKRQPEVQIDAETIHTEHDQQTTSQFCEPQPNPEEIVRQLQIASMLHSALEKLPAQYRAIICQRDLQECTGSEAADKNGISISNAKVRLHRARRALKETLLADFGGPEVFI